MKSGSSALYLVLLASSLYANKYVLSVLGFQYPMVFQGWQTLVGFLVFKVMSASGFSSAGVTPMDKSGFISLFPNFVLFVVFIIAGSKALSTYPLLAFVCAINVLPALTFLIDSYSSQSKSKGNTVLQQICGLVALPTAAAVVWATSHDMQDHGDPEAPKTAPIETGLIFGDMFWLAVHVGCGMALSFHSRIADQRYSFSERLFYSYVFALVVLAPASLYLEEAFEALNFKHRKQFRFLIGSVFSAGVGVALSLCQARLKEDPMFGRLHHTGLAVTALLSAALFRTTLPWWGWLCAVINLGAVVVVPSHIRPDEKIQASPPPVKPSGKSIRINMDDEEDKVALLEPDEDDLEVGRINERHLAS